MLKEPVSRPKVGIVVGSGGIKTLAAVELFRFFDEEKIPIDLLVGSSGGGILAALHGCGYSPDEIIKYIKQFWNKSLFTSFEYRTLLDIFQLPFGRFNKGRALLKPDLMKKTIADFFGDKRIEGLTPTTVIQATDVDTGEGVLLEKGLLSQALYVTGAQFPFLPPARIEGRWLADGGFSSSVPIMEAVKRGMDVIVAISFEQTSSEAGSFFDFCVHFFGRTYTMNVRSQTALAVDLHHHEIIIINVVFDEYINMWHVDKIPRILEVGRQSVLAQKEDILRIIREATPVNSPS